MDGQLLRNLARRHKVSFGTMEKDYALTSMLSKIANFPKIDSMIFKGGTAIKKSYLMDFRFSEDLDFSCSEDVSGDFVVFVENNMKSLDAGFTKVHDLDRNIQSVGFKVGYSQSVKWTANIKIDLSLREDAIMDHPARPILHFYENLGTFSIPVMSLEEIMAEKIRAMAYTRHPRHLYDVWYLHRHGITINSDMVRAKTKAAYSEDFELYRFAERLPEKAECWTKDLSHLLASRPPEFDGVAKYVLEAVTDAMGQRSSSPSR